MNNKYYLSLLVRELLYLESLSTYMEEENSLVLAVRTITVNAQEIKQVS